jgi:putative thioredoxin
MAHAAHVIDVTDATFPAAVLEESRRRTVVVDFWAPWCGPCRSLSPVLEKLAAEGDGRFVVAKVNTDENSRFAGEFGVRGIPAVFAVKDGEVVDAFTGALPEGQVRAFLDKVAPSPTDAAAGEGLALLARREDVAARACFDAVRAASPTDPRALLGLAVIAARGGDHDGARALLEAVATVPPKLQALAIEVRTLLQAGGGDVESARAAVAKDPTDVDAALALSALVYASGDAAGAFEALLSCLAKVKGPRRDELRRRIVELFDVVGARTPAVEDARKRLAALWFS